MHRRAVLALTLALSAAACGGGSKDGPSALPSSLAITGLPESLSVNTSVALGAEVRQGGVNTPCAASWTVDDAKLATVAGNGVLSIGASSGYLKVTATCGALTVTSEVRVQRTTAEVIVIAYDGALEPPQDRGAFDVGATIEFLDGTHTGRTFRSREALGSEIADITLPVKLRLTADGYQPRDAVLSDQTLEPSVTDRGQESWWLPMTFATDASTDTVADALVDDQTDAHLTFALKATGDVHVRTWWTEGFTGESVDVDLWCNGALVTWMAQPGGSHGQGFTRAVSTPGECQVAFHRLRRGAPLGYRLAVTYPKR